MSVLKKTILLCVAAAAVVVAQGQEAKVFPPSAEQKAEIHKKLAELSARIAALGDKKTDAALLADVQIYRKAADYILRFPEEFFGPNYVAETITALDTASVAPSSSKTAPRPGRRRRATSCAASRHGSTAVRSRTA